MLHEVYMCACYAKQKISLASSKVGGPTSITAVEWNLKIKDIVHNVVHYCITVSIKKSAQFINSFLIIQQILRSHELNGYAHFWPCPTKNHWNKFLLSWICTSRQKISLFHHLILEIQSNLEFHDQTGHIQFLIMATQNVFDQLLIVVNLCQHAKNLAISLIFSADMVH